MGTFLLALTRSGSIARRRERLDELDRQVGVPLRKFALDLTRGAWTGTCSAGAGSARKPQVKFLVNAAGFGMIGQVEELGLKSETDMVAFKREALCAVTRMVLPYMECNSRIIQYASSGGVPALSPDLPSMRLQNHLSSATAGP